MTFLWNKYETITAKKSKAQFSTSFGIRAICDT